MHFSDSILVGLFFLIVGQIIQIAYHHYHDRKQNTELALQTEYLRQIAENTAPKNPQG